MPEVTTVARRLARQHNNDEALHSGYIYEVNLATGRIGICVASYAVAQIEPGDDVFGQYAYLRIGHGRMSYAEAQRYLDDKGVGW